MCLFSINTLLKLMEDECQNIIVNSALAVVLPPTAVDSEPLPMSFSRFTLIIISLTSPACMFNYQLESVLFLGGLILGQTFS